MYIKICGLCRPADAEAATGAGADCLGVILAPVPPRGRTPAEAEEIFGAGGDAKRVGVFVDPEPEAVVGLARRLHLAAIQLHGGESPETVAALRAAGDWEVWKALRPRGRQEFLAGVAAYGDVADALLLDGWSGRRAGGTGTRFPWDEVAAVRDAVPHGRRLIIAGGLTPDTVADAVRRLAPDAVDVSSGVEVRAGEKSAAKLVAFIDRARAAVEDAGARTP